MSCSQIIRDNSVLQLKNEVDIQTICGHNSFIVKCLSFWQTHKEIYLRKCHSVNSMADHLFFLCHLI